ncbi:unnamed protein product [Spirodela intermedia]|uniref:Uncharacterized protein n=1 Tax=Spirodela intermedia TaxID=51605 RepID=A0A7I8J530_SPIIN|nr:unnamed protein product [Spirodela intermedia]CAA6664875.1 unnamed protein product [Spirodela intermedia]
MPPPPPPPAPPPPHTAGEFRVVSTLSRRHDHPHILDRSGGGVWGHGAVLLRAAEYVGNWRGAGAPHEHVQVLASFVPFRHDLRLPVGLPRSAGIGHGHGLRRRCRWRGERRRRRVVVKPGFRAAGSSGGDVVLLVIVRRAGGWTPGGGYHAEGVGGAEVGAPPGHGVEVGVVEAGTLGISALVRLEGRGVVAEKPTERREKTSEREALERRTVMWTLPSSLTSASASMAPSRWPSRETTSESTAMETMEPATSGNCSVMRRRAARYSYMKSMRVYQMMHWRTTICTMRLPV